MRALVLTCSRRYHSGVWTFHVARLSVSCLTELLKSVRSFGRLLRVAALLESTLDAAPNALLASAYGSHPPSLALQRHEVDRSFFFFARIDLICVDSGAWWCIPEQCTYSTS